MKTTMKLLIFTLAFALFGTAAYAQSPTRGTLNLSLNATSTVVSVSSATGFTAGTTAMVVDQEFMLVVSISGTGITVQRGRLSTVAAPHVNGAVFWVGGRDTGVFITKELSGACTAGIPNPVILPGEGIVQSCTGGYWNKMSVSAPMQVVRPRTACTASCTAAITDDIIGITVLSSANTITIMAASAVPAGKGFLVINETSTATTQISITPSSGNINGTSSYTFIGAYNFVHVVSNGSAWFAE